MHTPFQSVESEEGWDGILTAKGKVSKKSDLL